MNEKSIANNVAENGDGQIGINIVLFKNVHLPNDSWNNPIAEFHQMGGYQDGTHTDKVTRGPQGPLWMQQALHKLYATVQVWHDQGISHNFVP